MVIEDKFEDLKRHITHLLDSDMLTPEAILFKFFTPEELLLNGFLYKCIYEMGEEKEPISVYDVGEYIDKYKCNLTIREDTSGKDYMELINEFSVRSVMRYLEFELYIFLKNKRMEKDYCRNFKIWSLDADEEDNYYFDGIPHF